MGFLFIVLLLFFFLSILVLINLIFQKRLGMEAVLALTGAPGSGKSKVGVTKAVKAYKKRLWIWRLGLMGKVPRPLFYSNIPIFFKLPVCFGFGKREWSKVLTYEHLVLQERIAEFSVIFIDELGQFADQYSHNNPFVIQYLQKFIRFIRHYIDGIMIMTDQSSSNVVVAIRRRVNTIYNLSGFRRWLFFWYKTDVDEMMIAEDIMTFKDSAIDDGDKQYFMGHLPFKWFWFLDITRPFTTKAYDSRCFKPLFDDIEHSKTPDVWSEYMTKYLIELPNNKAMKDQFKRDGFISAEDMLKYVGQWKEATNVSQ